MHNRRGPVLLAVAAAVLPLRGMAASPETTADVRCVAVGIRAAALPDSAQKSTGLLMALYYIGRVDGREPALDLQAALKEQLGKMSAADFSAETSRCGASLNTKGAQITQLGQDLIKQLGAK